jgi:hypothetical protein
MPLREKTIVDLREQMAIAALDGSISEEAFEDAKRPLMPHASCLIPHEGVRHERTLARRWTHA